MFDLPAHYTVSPTFNVSDLSAYCGDDDPDIDSWLSLFKGGEDDAVQNEGTSRRQRLAQAGLFQSLCLLHY